MSETTVGTRDLKNNLSQYLRRVKAGETIIITERGKPIGQLGPTYKTLEERIWEMVRAGLAEWNGQHPKPYQPRIVNKTGQQISNLIMKDRR